MLADVLRRGLRGVQKSLSTAANPAQWFVDWVRPDPVAAGVSIDENTALNYSAVWCAVQLIASACASIPLILYRGQIGSMDRQRATDHPLYSLFKQWPNREQDTYIFREQLVLFLLLWGNYFAEIERNPLGDIAALWPLHPRHITVRRNKKSGRIEYVFKTEDSSQRIIQREDMWHVCGLLSDDGTTGQSVVRRAKQTIGLGIATEKFGAAFFGNGAVPSGILTHPRQLTDKARENIRSGWMKKHGTERNWHSTAILDEGIKYDKIGIPPEDAQFLETREHNIEEIARWFNIPVVFLQDLRRATFSNIEKQDLFLVKHSLRPWFVRLEVACRCQLLKPDEQGEYYWEFLIDALLRADEKTRTDTARNQFLNGALTLNEWRRMENRSSVPGEAGDTHFCPLNIGPVDKVIANADKPAAIRPNRDQKPPGPNPPK